MRYVPLLLLFILTACSENTSEDAQVAGKWTGTQWLVDGQPSGRNASQVTFEFQSDGSYTASFGAQTEAGSYRVEGNKLYTNAEGQVEKMVEVKQPNPDTLRMDMNRAGTPEVLVLAKQ